MLSPQDLDALAHATHSDPFSLLGLHRAGGKRAWRLHTVLPGAVSVRVVEAAGGRALATLAFVSILAFYNTPAGLVRNSRLALLLLFSVPSFFFLYSTVILAPHALSGIAAALAAHRPAKVESLAAVRAVDLWAREYADDLARGLESRQV